MFIYIYIYILYILYIHICMMYIYIYIMYVNRYLYMCVCLYNKLRKGRRVNKNALFYPLVSPGGFFSVDVSNL